MRYYRLVRADGGTLPADGPLQIGAIVRVRSTRSRLPGTVWNAETREWVTPRWVECENPMAEVKS